MTVPRVMVEAYFEPTWAAYFEGLVKITEPHLSKGPVLAQGCGHRIAKDNPQVVADELTALLHTLSLVEASRI